MRGLAESPNSKPMVKVLHVITGMNTGGAENMLCKLLEHSRREFLQQNVVSLMGRGSLSGRAEKTGAQVIHLNHDSYWGMVRAVRELADIIDLQKPDIVQGWMYHGNAVASLASLRRKSAVKTVWNIRHSINQLLNEKWATAGLILAGVPLSVTAKSIIYNSAASKEQHERFGYGREKGLVIPNGFDCDLFRPDRERGSAFRAEMGIPANATVLGLVARYHPIKNHALFIHACAAAIRARNDMDIRVLMVGRGVENNPSLVSLTKQLGINDRVIMSGDRQGMVEVFNAIDLLCLTSHSEGFPNVIGEAMACGVPCCVTDVGDAALIVGRAGRVVPVKNPSRFADALTEMLGLDINERASLGRVARASIVNRYGIDAICGRYEMLYAELTKVT